MVKQRAVLKFIAEQTGKRRSVSFIDLVHEFDLSPEAACDHLKRLWRERVIEAVSYRPYRYYFRLRPGESLRDVRFHLAPRGEERLRWYSKRDEDAGWPWQS